MQLPRLRLTNPCVSNTHSVLLRKRGWLFGLLFGLLVGWWVGWLIGRSVCVCAEPRAYLRPDLKRKLLSRFIAHFRHYFLVVID